MSARTVLASVYLIALIPASAFAQVTPAEMAGPERTELRKPTVSVPIDNWGGRPVVEARINGKGPFKLLIDTGTGFAAVLDHDLAKKLQLTATGKTKPDSQAEDPGTFKIDSVTIGDAEFAMVEAVVSEIGGVFPTGSQKIVGILGLPLFRDCLLTLDSPNKRVTLESGELGEPDGETIEYSADTEHDYGITVTLSAAGVPVKAHLDTGSPALVTLLNKYQKKLPLKDEPRLVGIARTPQGEAEVRTATLDGTLKLGKHEWHQPRLDFADLAPMVKYDAGNIGSRLLNEFAVTVDQKTHRVRFRRD